MALFTSELKLSNGPMRNKRRTNMFEAKSKRRLDRLTPHGSADYAKENHWVILKIQKHRLLTSMNLLKQIESKE